MKSLDTFAPVIRDSGFGFRFRYSVFAVFPHFKNFPEIKNQNNTKANTKKKNSAQPIISSTDHAQNYPKITGKKFKTE